MPIIRTMMPTWNSRLYQQSCYKWCSKRQFGHYHLFSDKMTLTPVPNPTDLYWKLSIMERRSY